MDGRYFDFRQIKCHFWDSKTDYRFVQETAEELQKRVDDFGQWLSNDPNTSTSKFDKD